MVTIEQHASLGISRNVSISAVPNCPKIFNMLRYYSANIYHANLIQLSNYCLISSTRQSCIHYPMSKKKPETKPSSFLKDNKGKSESLLLK